MPWWGWGEREGAALSEPLRLLVEQALGMARRDTPAVPQEAVRLPPVRLDAAALAALVAAVGPTRVLTDTAARLHHCGGKSTSDLLRLRAGGVITAPDAVVLPRDHDEVLAVLTACTEHRVAVVPFGGGTSVVGGLEPLRDGLAGCISLDLRSLDRLLDVDPVSMTATLEPGLTGRRAEELLAAHGLTIGHFPQSFEHATLGGFAATRSVGQASAGYGRFDELVEGLLVATPEGTFDLGRAPASAAGPDLRQLFLGSEGTLGVITRLRLRVRPAPAVRAYEGWLAPDLSMGVSAVRALAQSNAALPAVLRLSDESETVATTAAEGRSLPAGCLLIAGYEGDRAAVRARRRAAGDLLRAHGVARLGPGPGRAWERGRYRAPYLRDALLGAGVLTEVLETATSWAGLTRLHAAVAHAMQEALAAQGTAGLLLAHVSHVYPTGASLYFTLVAAQAEDPLAQWTAVARAAGDAIVAAGATISHHHGVGVAHRDRMIAEIGALGIETLRTVKARLDPGGILNPGKLLPPPGSLPSSAR